VQVGGGQGWTVFVHSVCPFALVYLLCLQVAERLYTSGYLSYPRTESSAYPPNFDIKGEGWSPTITYFEKQLSLNLKFFLRFFKFIIQQATIFQKVGVIWQDAVGGGLSGCSLHHT
jgi:hypothetical protein